MDIQTIAILVTASSTVIYTIGTFLLWNITNTSVRLTRQEMERKEKLTQATIVSSIYKNFREIYSLIINDSENLAILAKENGNAVSDIKREYIASFLINHSFEIYEYNLHKLIPDEFWNRVVIDMQALYKWDFVRIRWIKVSYLFPRDFVKFINEHIIIINYY